MNPSHLTRREQVLRLLRSKNGGWVDGPELANEQVGGSEGLKRVRELRLEGYDIQMRKHPNPARDIWQYRLVAERKVGQPPQLIDAPTKAPQRYTEPPKRLAFGEAIPCPACEGRKVRIDPLTKKRGPCSRCNGIGVVPVP